MSSTDVFLAPSPSGVGVIPTRMLRRARLIECLVPPGAAADAYGVSAARPRWSLLAWDLHHDGLSRRTRMPHVDLEIATADALAWCGSRNERQRGWVLDATFTYLCHLTAQLAPSREASREVQTSMLREVADPALDLLLELRVVAQRHPEEANALRAHCGGGRDGPSVGTIRWPETGSRESCVLWGALADSGSRRGTSGPGGDHCVPSWPIPSHGVPRGGSASP